MNNFKEDFDALVEQDDKGNFKNSVEYQLVEDPFLKRKWYCDVRDLKEAKERCKNPDLKVYDKKHVLTFDTKWKYQDVELEERYKEFKEYRDADLQPRRPKHLIKVLEEMENLNSDNEH